MDIVLVSDSSTILDLTALKTTNQKDHTASEDQAVDPTSIQT